MLTVPLFEKESTQQLFFEENTKYNKKKNLLFARQNKKEKIKIQSRVIKKLNVSIFRIDT